MLKSICLFDVLEYRGMYLSEDKFCELQFLFIARAFEKYISSFKDDICLYPIMSQR